MEKEEIIITLITQVRDDVTDLSKSVARTNAKVVSNGTKLDSVIRYNKECEGRLGGLEEWKAGHTGFSAGRDKRVGVFHSKITIIGTVVGIVLGLAGFWYGVISPALNERTGVLDRIAFIEARYLESSTSLKD